MPTLCSVAGYFPGQDLRWDGIDLWPQLTGAAPVKPRAVYMASPGFNARMLREADWKLIEPRAPAGIAPGQKPRVMELYDIVMDPFETKNLASSMPERVAELTEKLREVSKSDGDASAK
jgi:arylsulfatase A-like enzyme